MHASLEQLISLRDGEPVAADATAHIRKCIECNAALHNLTELSDKLRALPGFQPPAGAWQRIVSDFDVQHHANPRRFWIPAASVGFVVALVVAVVLVGRPVRQFETVSSTAAASSASGALSVAQLQSQSRYLESALLTMNADANNRAVSAATAATVAALEDRIALIDYAINQTASRPDADQDLTQLWQQRVTLLQSLAAVRYAQVSDIGL